jgi:hypothetical protein
MSETLHQERQPNTALKPTAAQLLRSTFAGVRTRAARSTVLAGGLWLSFVSLGPVPEVRNDITLVRKLIRYSPEILRSMKKVEGDWEASYGLWQTLRVLFPREVLLSLILGIVLAALLIGAVFAVHWLISLVRKRRTRVFISFHHEREPVADVLADEMTKCGIRAEKLPFVESRDSDTLLEQVRQQIDDCDIFVCVPGNRQSFVDYEVSSAYQVKKPILFVLIEADAPQLPDTAMKGSPVFTLEGLRREGFRTLANFCSYLAADSRSTARLYKAVFHHLQYCGGLAVAVYVFLMVILTYVMPFIDQHYKSGSLLGPPPTLVPKSAIFWFVAATLILFLVPYGLFFVTRLTIREDVRHVISGKKFTRDTFIPETLAYGLKGVDLHKILYHGDVVTHHESDRPDAKSS